MTKNAKTVSLAAIALVALALIAFMVDEFARIGPHPLDCEDGRRYAIDIREFATQYSSYSAELQGNLAGKGSVSAKLNPVQQQQMSEAFQTTREFQKFLIAGYNSCAVEKKRFERYRTKFQILDSLAREINDLTTRITASSKQADKLAT